MSAVATPEASRDVPLVSRTTPSITARASLAAEKAQFVALAAAAGLSESAFALQTIRAVLHPEAEAVISPATVRAAATDRITIRLRPGDGAGACAPAPLDAA